MADGYRNSAGVDASMLYDPDVNGDGYNATFLKRGNGTTLKYALASYGTPGPNLGFRDSSGNDVGPKWCAIGTAHYGLPFSGVNYIASGNVGPNISFSLPSTTTYSISTTSTSLTGTPTSGAINPTGVPTQVMITSITYDSGLLNYTGLATDTWTNISAGLLVAKFNAYALTGSSANASALVKFRDASGTILSSSYLNFTLHNTNPA